MPITDVVRARIDLGTKERAAAALADMGLPLSEAIRLPMVGVADERRLPSERAGAHAIARQAEREGRQARAFARIADFMAELRNQGFRPD
jgi:DNA-damage-inducible protein J